MVLPPRASGLFAKHAQYVGWQAGDPSVQGWVATGTRTNGRVVDPFAEKRSGVAYRDTLTAFPYFDTGEPFFMMLSQRLRESGAARTNIRVRRSVLSVRECLVRTAAPSATISCVTSIGRLTIPTRSLF